MTAPSINAGQMLAELFSGSTVHVEFDNGTLFNAYVCATDGTIYAATGTVTSEGTIRHFELENLTSKAASAAEDPTFPGFYDHFSGPAPATVIKGFAARIGRLEAAPVLEQALRVFYSYAKDPTA